MVKNHCLAQSINDASWYQFRAWLDYFGKVFGKITIAVPAAGDKSGMLSMRCCG
jgi:putative transposase